MFVVQYTYLFAGVVDDGSSPSWAIVVVVESQSQLVDPASGNVWHKLAFPFLAGWRSLGLLKFKSEKLEFRFELRIVVQLLGCSSSQFELLLVFVLFREVVIVIYDAAIVKGLLRDDDAGRVKSLALNVLSELLRVVVMHVF